MSAGPCAALVLLLLQEPPAEGAAAAAATTDATAPAQAQPRRGRYVFAFMPALVFGINAWMIPSLTGSFFFGGRLRDERWALGVQATASTGLADRYLAGLGAFRFHVTALHSFKTRGFASVGGGMALLLLLPAIVEVEGRAGVRVGRRNRGLIGGMVRLGLNFGFHERAPLPQFGIFTGFSFL